MRIDRTEFRRATADDAQLLNQMTLDGLRHWGHDKNFPDLFHSLASKLPDGDKIAQSPVFVLEQNDQAIGFYGLRDREEHMELLRMFLNVERIGHGYGRLLWDHAVNEAAALRDRMLIMSDPEAVGFYVTMGATLERMQQVAPGFSLGVFWVDLRP